MSERRAKADSESEETELLQEQLGAYYEQLKETPQFQAVKRVKDNVANYIEKNPIQSAAIALGVGFLLGMLFNSRKRD
jgi:ElaB/YqjD/DUF883 family membrane-anchored ribosome-binding protein